MPQNKIIFAGDIYSDTSLILDSKLVKLLRNHSLRVFNLEGAFSQEGEQRPKAGPHLKINENNITSILKHFDLAILANNHSMDFGLEGLLRTIGTCHTNYCECIGAGKNIKEAFNPYEHHTCQILSVAEHEFGGAGPNKPGIATTDYPRKIYHKIQEGKKANKQVIVVAHGGSELIPIPPPYIRERYKLWIDYGADLVIGNHPHVVQGFESYKGKMIFYGLGNFAFLRNNFLPSKEESWSIIVSYDLAKGNTLIYPVSFDMRGFIKLHELKDFENDIKRLNKLLRSNNYHNIYQNLSENLFPERYQSLYNVSNQNTEVLLHYFRCDAHRNMIASALDSAVDKKQKKNKKLRTVVQNKKTTASPFLILCSASCGSTLLSVLLDNHPEISIGPELAVFNKLKTYLPYPQFVQELPELIQKGTYTGGQVEYSGYFDNLNAYFWDKDDIIKISHIAKNTREFWELFFSNILYTRGKATWGEKTGSNAYHVKSFLDIFPETKIIHLLRDPRDSINSIINRTKEPTYYNIFHATSHVLYNHAAAISAGSDAKKNYMLIRYEDFVQDPKHTLRKIFTHIGVDKNISTANSNYWHQNSKNNVHNTWSNSPFDKINTSSIGKHITELPELAFDFIDNLKLTAHSKHTLDTKITTLHDLLSYGGYRHAINTGKKLNLDNLKNMVKKFEEDRRARERFKHDVLYNSLFFI